MLLAFDHDKHLPLLALSADPFVGGLEAQAFVEPHSLPPHNYKVRSHLASYFIQFLPVLGRNPREATGIQALNFIRGKAVKQRVLGCLIDVLWICQMAGELHGCREDALLFGPRLSRAPGRSGGLLLNILTFHLVEG